jgi:hypothetical protein
MEHVLTLSKPLERYKTKPFKEAEMKKNYLNWTEVSQKPLAKAEFFATLSKPLKRLITKKYKAPPEPTFGK